jgi:hypothetical protein
MFCPRILPLSLVHAPPRARQPPHARLAVTGFTRRIPTPNRRRRGAPPLSLNDVAQSGMSAPAPATATSTASVSGSASPLGLHPPVLIELGSAWIRAGVVGESGPRVTARLPAALSEALCGGLLSSSRPPAATSSSSSSPPPPPSPVLARLLDELADVFSSLFLRGLLLRPSDHRVVLVEPLLFSSELRWCLAQALLNRLHCPALRHVQQPLAAAASAARNTALVVDVGMADTRILPVVLGQAVVEAACVVPRGASALHAVAGEVLLAAAARAAVAAAATTQTAAPPRPYPSPPTALVPHPGRAYAELGYDFPPYGSSHWRPGLLDVDLWGREVEGVGGRSDDEDGPLRCHAGGLEGACARWVETSVARYGQVLRRTSPPSETTTGAVVDIPVPRTLALALGLAPTRPADPAAPTGSFLGTPGYSVSVPATAWSRCFDLFFDPGAPDDAINACRGREEALSADVPQPLLGLLCRARAAAEEVASVSASFTPLHLAAAQALRLAPVDSRRALASGVIVCGGPSALPGFPLRLLTELAAAVDPSFDLSASAQGGAAVAARSGGGGSGGGAGALSSLRALLPHLALANSAAVPLPLTTFVGASAFALALATTPLIVPAATSVQKAIAATSGSAGAGGSAVAAGAAAAASTSTLLSVVRSDSLTETSLARGGAFDGAEAKRVAAPATAAAVVGPSRPRRDGPLADLEVRAGDAWGCAGPAPGAAASAVTAPIQWKRPIPSASAVAAPAKLPPAKLSAPAAAAVVAAAAAPPAAAAPRSRSGSRTTETAAAGVPASAAVAPAPAAAKPPQLPAAGNAAKLEALSARLKAATKK